MFLTHVAAKNLKFTLAFNCFSVGDKAPSTIREGYVQHT